MGIIHSVFRFSNPVRTDLQSLDRRLSLAYCGPIRIRINNRHSVDLKPESANVPQSFAT